MKIGPALATGLIALLATLGCKAIHIQPLFPWTLVAPVFKSSEQIRTGQWATTRITVRVKAEDPRSRPLHYRWSANLGSLEAGDKPEATWSPVKPDGTIEPGQAVVNVTISNDDLAIASDYLMVYQLNADGSLSTVRDEGHSSIRFTEVPIPR